MAWPSRGHSGGTLRRRRPVEDHEDDDPDQRNGGCACGVREASASRAPLRLLDQRFDEGLELLTVDRIPGTRRAGWSGDRQGRLPNTIALVLLAPVIRVKVNKSDPTDLYEQVAAEIRRAIAEGEAKPGERLPPAKDLAAILGVNTNTVLRSLRMLRDEGLLEFRRGRGISVAGTPERGAVVQRAKELVHFARGQGYRLDELVKIIEDVG
jgi:GntR family transcriptional regulator